MYKVSLTNTSINYLGNYFDLYRGYFESLFEDSGIWSENQIINSYIEESKSRKNEVLNLIKETLQEEKVLGIKNDNSIIMKWRTKYLFIEFEENIKLKERYVISLSIR